VRRIAHSHLSHPRSYRVSTMLTKATSWSTNTTCVCVLLLLVLGSKNTESRSFRDTIPSLQLDIKRAALFRTNTTNTVASVVNCGIAARNTDTTNYTRTMMEEVEETPTVALVDANDTVIGSVAALPEDAALLHRTASLYLFDSSSNNKDRLWLTKRSHNSTSSSKHVSELVAALYTCL
jgi:hypothetical protein